MQANRLAFFICKPNDLLLFSASHMTCGMAQRHAVLTGDLIGSTAGASAEVDRAMALIDAAARRYGPDARFHRYRGDGWQVHVGPGARGLGAMVYIAAVLRAEGALPSRIALGLGEAHGLEAGTLGQAGGPAFLHSGRALDAMGPDRRLALAGDGVDPLHDALMAYVDSQITGWSVPQAEAMALVMAPAGPQSLTELAEGLGIRRQALAARLNAGGFKLIEKTLQAFAQHFADEATDG